MAVLKLYDIPATHDLIYKLSVFTHLKLQEHGSFGDIAASTFGGWIAYSTFDRKWVLNKIEEVPFTELMHTQWPSLRIEPLPVPSLQLLIGWTGNPASTTNLIEKMQSDLHNHQVSKLEYDEFLDYAKICVEEMIQAFYQNNTNLICQNLNKYRNLLHKFANMTNLQIETSALKELTRLAQTLNIAAKSSGAGGGDCGIALVKDKKNVKRLSQLWEKNGITPLTDISIYYEEQGVNYE